MERAKYLIWAILNWIYAMISILLAVSSFDLFLKTMDFRYLLILPVFALSIKGVQANGKKAKEHMEWIRKVEKSMEDKAEDEPEEGLFGEE